MVKLHFRNQYEMEVEKPGVTFTEPTRTKQEYKDECDITTILRKFEATGIVDHVSQFQPIFADLTQFGDLQEAFEIVRNAEESFLALPSALRAELDNNPANLVGFINNPANKERCIEYGIFNKPIETVGENRVVNPVADSSSSNAG